MKRRNFLKMTGLATLWQHVWPAFNHLSDEKSLVCLFLYGGHDSFHFWLPYDSDRYDQYAAARQNLALPRDSLLPVDDQYAFHPNLSALHGLYQSGQLAIINNVGNLIVPTRRQDYLNQSVPLPAGLFSHSHQQEIWQTNQNPVASITYPGWGGLMADRLQSGNMPVSFSLVGSNLWQSGEQTQPFSLDPEAGAENFYYFNYEDWPPNEIGRSQAWQSILNLSRSDLMVQYQGQLFQSAQDRIAILKEALKLTDPEQGGISIQTPYDAKNKLAVQLRMVARMIYARSYLGQNRQFFFTGVGGFDTHGQQLNTLDRLYAGLDSALASFQSTLVELGLDNSVVLFSASDFGRTLSINGDGTDHGWGSHAFVLGTPVNGGQIFGEFPSLSLGGPDDAGEYGRLIPKISVDQYGATLAQWLGISVSDCLDIFPHLNEFDQYNLGFV